MKDALVFKGKEPDTSIAFYGAHLNDEKEIILRDDSAGILGMYHEARLCEGEGKLEIRQRSKQGKRILLRLGSEHEEAYKNLIQFKKDTLHRLNQLVLEIMSGKEKVVALKLGDEEPVFYVTTPVILEKGTESIKYQRALEYCTKSMAKELGKEVLVTDFNTLQQLLESLFQKGVASGILKESLYEGETAVKTTLKELIELA